MPTGRRLAQDPTLAFLGGGTFQRAIGSATGQNWVADSEFEITTIAANIIADDSMDAMFSWVKYDVALSCPIGGGVFEVMVIRCDKDVAMQDLNSAAGIEELQKQHRILKHYVRASGQTGYVHPIVISDELHKVKLDDDEEIRMVVRPLIADANGSWYCILQWREVGR